MPTPDAPEPAQVTRWLGLRNQQEGQRLPLGALRAADNVIVTDTGGIIRRPGFGLANLLGLSDITDQHGTDHQRYGYVVGDGKLLMVNDTPQSWVLADGLADGVYQWAQVGDHAFLAGKTEAWWVRDGDVYPIRLPMPPAPEVEVIAGSLPAGQYQFTQVFEDVTSGLQTPAPASYTVTVPGGSAFIITSRLPEGHVAHVYVAESNDSVERWHGTTIEGVAVNHFYFNQKELDELSLSTIEDAQTNTQTMPKGEVLGLAWLAGRLYAAFLDDTGKFSRVFYSVPDFYTCWRTEEDAFEVPGRVLQMQGLDGGILIVTDKEIILFGEDGSLTTLAPYGAAPDSRRPIAVDDKGAVIQTTRGPVTFPPFDDRAQLKYIPAPGSRAFASLAYLNGMRLALAHTDDKGIPFTYQPNRGKL